MWFILALVKNQEGRIVSAVVRFIRFAIPSDLSSTALPYHPDRLRARHSAFSSVKHHVTQWRRQSASLRDIQISSAAVVPTPGHRSSCYSTVSAASAWQWQHGASGCSSWTLPGHQAGKNVEERDQGPRFPRGSWLFEGVSWGNSELPDSWRARDLVPLLSQGSKISEMPWETKATAPAPPPSLTCASLWCLSASDPKCCTPKLHHFLTLWDKSSDVFFPGSHNSLSHFTRVIYSLSELEIKVSSLEAQTWQSDLLTP